jgi:hypothetical protein
MKHEVLRSKTEITQWETGENQEKHDGSERRVVFTN